MSAKRSALSKQAVDRWNKMWEAQTARMERQKEALTRMAHMTTESVAALTEIAECDDINPDEHNETVVYLKDRAKQALAVIEQLRLREEAAADDIDGEG
jgi:hypothetical protein